MERKITSGIMLTLLLTGMLTLAFRVQPATASGTIYIRADGSVEGTTSISSLDNVTYTFTDNISDSIVVQRNNIIIDGNGYLLQGAGSGNGISLYGRENVTIRNVQIKSFYFGILLSGSLSNTISGNDVSNNRYGIELIGSSNNNIISGNNVSSNGYGIHLSSSSNNTVSGNNATNNGGYGFAYGIGLVVSSNNTVSGNNATANEEWGIWLDRSSNNTISGNKATNNNIGIELYWSSSNNTISGNKATNNADGIKLSESSNNNIVSGNNVTDNTNSGIYLFRSSNNAVSGNNATNNGGDGIWLYRSSNNNVSGNNATNNGGGLSLYDSSNNNVISGNNAANNIAWNIRLSLSSNNNIISGNNVTANAYRGIYLAASSNNNKISGNNVTNNYYGIQINHSSTNKFYHNNFRNNVIQVYSGDSTNVWDDGYPSGGNYWSNYAGTDLYNGPYRNVTGSDGIGDTPHPIYGDQDNYPFMSQNGWQTHPIRIESNVTISHMTANRYSLNFTVSGPSGQRGYVNATVPVGLNTTKIKVFIDDVELIPPFPIITSNGTHYFVYFEFTLSTHNITVEYAIAEIAATNVTPHKTIVGQGYSMCINVTTQNQGDYEETFNVTVYANTTTIETREITLTSGSSSTVTFTWNTTGFAKGNYTIWAYAWPVKGERDTGNNTFIDGTVRVNMVGDLNSDGRVTITDIVIIALAFNSKPGDSNWNPNADMNDNGQVTITDVVIAALHFGETDP